jgi:hypothetical protein
MAASSVWRSLKSPPCDADTEDADTEDADIEDADIEDASMAAIVRTSSPVRQRGSTLVRDAENGDELRQGDDH